MNDIPDRPPETAASVREQAAERRAQAAAARAEADATQQAAQAQVDAILAAARARSAELAREATNAERAAAPLDERASYLDAAEQLRDKQPHLEQLLADLAAEADRIANQVEDLDRRLAELGEQREALGVRLAAARDAGRVDDVVEARTRMAAVDEVTAALTGQQDAAVRRLQAIGGLDDQGEYARAAAVLRDLNAELRRVENWLYPERPEAVQDRLWAEVQLSLAANLERIAADEQQQAAPHTITHITGR